MTTTLIAVAVVGLIFYGHWVFFADGRYSHRAAEPLDEGAFIQSLAPDKVQHDE